ncbi:MULTISPECIES: GIY-YIG nuclease family protein [unclassified Lysinibacillus]|uniref:GIY-YIG nuclease family protein n=1 Tax=unclassified Lysinibacillus TaxID=2636778 RepID=UPI00201105C4|nr:MULTISPECIES: GIY-YIG nuclease family protein [unclassified Lysinibacillus]MCL1698443.1 GIY-YIG nuclease family protein [Lysinibacillus sp. BPa_S21]MCL1703344.1 GIY-YIG nuclease family protein [Lysinibacillus sp. Bpr_S20]
MEKNNSHYFYVLECADQSFYAGYTNNVDKRVGVHNAGKGAKYTRARGPVECIYVEEFDTKQEAMRAEYAFKQLTRKQKMKYIGRDDA